MRKVRITYEGAVHHITNRGVLGEAIFRGDKNKSVFLELIKEKSCKLKIKILAYCIMDNHYHLVIQNTSGRMSDFMMQLNGNYGIYYRKQFGGKGYVFQNRYQSTLVQEELYLMMVIGYVLLNPVKAGIVKNFSDYYWSSFREYFIYEESGNTIVDNDFLNQLYGGKYELIRFVNTRGRSELPISSTRYGNILGDETFTRKAIKSFNRRKRTDGDKRLRKDDKYFEPVEKVIQEFEKTKEIKIDKIDIGCFQGKRLRGELLVSLKDLSGLTYKEIIHFPIFSDLQFNSLGKIYRDTRKRIQRRTQKVKK